MYPRVPYEAGNFLSSWVTISFSRRTLLYEVSELLLTLQWSCGGGGRLVKRNLRPSSWPEELRELPCCLSQKNGMTRPRELVLHQLWPQGTSTSLSPLNTVVPVYATIQLKSCLTWPHNTVHISCFCLLSQKPVAEFRSSVKVIFVLRMKASKHASYRRSGPLVSTVTSSCWFPRRAFESCQPSAPLLPLRRRIRPRFTSPHTMHVHSMFRFKSWCSFSLWIL